METVFEWLPRVGAIVTVLIGLTGFFKPTAITDGCDIELTSAKALSEARGVFGGLMLGWGAVAFVLNDPSVFLALGVAWALATAARFYSMVADGSTMQDSIPPIIVDGGIALLVLSSQF